MLTKREIDLLIELSLVQINLIVNQTKQYEIAHECLSIVEKLQQAAQAQVETNQTTEGDENETNNQ